MTLTVKYNDDHADNQRDLEVYAGSVLVATITVHGGTVYYTEELNRKELELLTVEPSGAINYW